MDLRLSWQELIVYWIGKIAGCFLMSLANHGTVAAIANQAALVLGSGRLGKVPVSQSWQVFFESNILKPMPHALIACS
jgi:hypothetical protein